MQANIHDAKTRLSYLAKCAAEGERVIIAKAGKPYVQLVALDQKKRTPGLLAGKVAIDKNAFLDGDKEVAALFENSL